MAQDLSIEIPTAVHFITSRTIASRLWFVNNPTLEYYILAFLAKYRVMYGVQLFGFILMGNHYHLIARFPRGNKSAFLKAFGSIVARLVASHAKDYVGGKLWARRARPQILPEAPDVEHWMLYAALNPVSSGLTQKYSDYPSYNSFSDAIAGRLRTFKLVDWQDFKNRKRRNRNLTPESCTESYDLVYERIPGYDHLSQSEYRELFLKKAEERRRSIVEKRTSEGEGFAGVQVLKSTKPGASPKSTKSSTRDSRRPLVLTLCAETKRLWLEIYFSILSAYREASKRFREGDLLAQFPPGTYRPILLCPP